MTPKRRVPSVQLSRDEARRRHQAINQFAKVMDQSRAGNVANASRRYYGEGRQARELANFHAFMSDKRNRGLAYGFSRNG